MGLLDLFRKRSAVDGHDVDNRVLLKAMTDMSKNSSPENRSRLYRTLSEATLVVPTPELPPEMRKPGASVASDSMKVGIVSVVDQHGRKITPVFTDFEALANWDPNTPCFGLKARALFQLLRTSDIQEIVINPFDPIRKMIRPGGRITRMEFDALADGMMPEPGTNGVKFNIPASSPIDMSPPEAPLAPVVVEAIRNIASATTGIEEMYSFSASIDKGAPRICVGVRLQKGVDPQEREVMAKLIDAAGPHLTEFASLDFLALRGPLYDRAKQVGKRIFP